MCKKPASKYHFKFLKKRATGEQNKVFDSTKGYVQGKTTKEASPEETVGYLLNGLDYKGQIQMASVASGVGVGAEIAIDPLAIAALASGAPVAPDFVSLKVGAGASVKSAKQRTVVISRGPSELDLEKNGRLLELHKISKPIVIHSLVGRYWETQGKAWADVSVGVGVSTPTLPGVPLSASAGAKVGAKAEGSYTYDHFYAEDVYPLYFDGINGKSECTERLALILEEGSTKTALKRDACEFMKESGTKIHLHSDYLFHTTTRSTKEIIAKLEEFLEKDLNEEVKSKAKEFIEKLRTFGYRGDNSCFLRLSSHKPEGKAGIYAKASAEVQALSIANAGIDACAFLGVSGSYKHASARFQTMAYSDPVTIKKKPPFVNQTGDTICLLPSLNSTVPIYTTYDTSVTYSSFDVGPVLSAEGTIGLGIGSDMVSGSTSRSKSVDTKGKTTFTFNQVSYVCAIAFWARPDEFLLQTYGKKKTSRFVVPILAGTGIAVGQTFSVWALKKFYKKYYDPEKGWGEGAIESSYIATFAKALRINSNDRQKILNFLGDSGVYGLMQDSFPDDASIFFEAGFALNNYRSKKLKVSVYHDEIKIRGSKSTQKKTQIQLDKKFSSDWKEQDLELESIRLRYRRRDLLEKDKTLFTVGFKTSPATLAITLDKVDRAGADAIIDLATVFVSDTRFVTDTLNVTYTLNELHNSKPGLAYERAVPPAALFLQ